MKRIITILIFLSFINLINAQVGGLSASKLATLCVETVPVKAIEFEPALGISFTEKKWNNSGQLLSVFPYNDSIITDSYMGFRITYGLLRNMEAGISFPVDMSTVQLAAKYKLPFEYQNLQVGIFAGANFFTGNNIISKKQNSINNTSSIISGIILSYQASKSLSIDFDIQYQHLTHSVLEKHNHDIIINSDIGYFIQDIQLVLGLNYIQSDYQLSDYNYYRLSLNPGITIERAQNFILVLNFPYDIIGKNVGKSLGCALALTIVID